MVHPAISDRRRPAPAVGPRARPPAQPPAVHLSAGVLIARDSGPLDAEGRPSASGPYAFVSVGMSNTTQEFSAFKPMADSDGSRDPRLTIVDGAQGGMTASQWANAGCPGGTARGERLASSGISARQVAVAWIKLADSQPGEGWPAHALRLRDET